VLALGDVCDQCQKWASRDVDPAVWQEDIVLRQWLSWFAVPGKPGRPTAMSGGSGDTFDPMRGVVTMKPDVRTDAQVVRGETFLSRAVHKMGLGALAWHGPRERAFAQAYDGIANAVRQGSFRAYARAIGRWVDPGVGIAVSVADDLVGIQAYAVTWWISLAEEPADSWARLRSIAGVHVTKAPRDNVFLNTRTTFTQAVTAAGMRLLVQPIKVDEHGWIDPSSVFQPPDPIQILAPNDPPWRA
jgi:hypothetical protein